MRTSDRLRDRLLIVPAFGFMPAAALLPTASVGVAAAIPRAAPRLPAR